jgi:hypothetical protein
MGRVVATLRVALVMREATRMVFDMASGSTIKPMGLDTKAFGKMADDMGRGHFITLICQSIKESGIREERGTDKGHTGWLQVIGMKENGGTMGVMERGCTIMRTALGTRASGRPAKETAKVYFLTLTAAP